MIRFAVIGTNWISHKFCQAAHSSGRLQLSAVYSRELITAQAFAEEYSTPCNFYTDIAAMAADPELDAVYIASPNALHYPQAALFLQHGKHVISEKPLASNSGEVESLIAIAQQNNVVLFEALKTRYNPNFMAIEQALPQLGTLRKVHFTYCQFSSRYPRYLAGENPNTFNPELSNGSLMDIGIYPLGVALNLFGEPNKVMATGTLLASGADAHGSLLMQYPDFDVVISHSKVSDGVVASEIQGELGTLVISHISECDTVHFYPRNGDMQDLTREQAENTMLYEAQVFADLIERGDVNHAELARSRLISKVLTEARMQIGVTYPADLNQL
ncbi:MAG: Gfo/Idh/MocA family protein [Plesiomonas sp.]